jgi:hypothetical protein
MKGFLLLLFGLLLATSGFCQVSDTLVYTSDRKLTWEDFKGKPKFTEKNKGAQITVTINLKVKKVSFWSGRVTYDAYALAFKNESWVKDEYKDAYTLAHEQLHFDIAHIYAETLELEINNLNKDEGRKVEDIVKKCTREMIAYQEVYDRETHGGNNIGKQKQWATMIKKDLNLIN